MTATARRGAHPARRELSLLVEGAVDVFDAAARLESRGYGDAVAVRRGFSDVFDHARALDRGAPAELVDEARGATLVIPGESHAATWARAAMVLASVLMCLPVLPTQGVTSMFVAASAGWLGAQAVSAALYWGLGRRDLAGGARLALTCLVPMLAAGAVTALVTGWWQVPVWMLAGFAAAYANTAHADLRRALVLLALSLGSFVMGGTLGTFAGGSLILGFAGWSLVSMVPLARTGRRPSARGWSLVLWSVLGALALQAVLLVLLHDRHVSFPVIALAGTAAGVLGGPLLDGCVRYLRRLTADATVWRQVRRRMFSTGIVFAVELGALAAGMSVAVAWVFAGRHVTAVEGAAAFLIGALSACSGILMRVGTARGAAVVLGIAAVALLSTQMGLTLADVRATSALLGIAAVAGLVAAARLARPGWW